MAKPLATLAPRLIVGLGNPGEEYAKTRHNAGFWLCTRLTAHLNVDMRREARFHGIAGRSGTQHFLMPQNFMNRSGQSVAALANFHRIAPAEILVLHDELDLQPGTARLKFGGSAGGRNGLKDITAQLGTQDYWRLRIGIGHPGDRDAVVGFVLKPPQRAEHQLIDEALDLAESVWPQIASGDYEAAMRLLNKRTVPPENTL